MRRLALALLVSSCSGAATTANGGSRLFTPEWQNDGGKSIAAVHARVQAKPPPAGVAVAVGVTSRGLIGMQLDGSGKWSYSSALDARPVVTGEVVVGSGGGNVFALDARSGKELWRAPSEGRALRGAGDDGAITVATLDGPSGGDSVVMVVSRSGKVLLDEETGVALGRPAAQAGVVFIPWGNQYVSALDGTSGAELGRLLTREQVSHAINIAGTLYFGERSLMRFDSEIAKAASGGAHAVALPERELPGKPVWLEDGNEPTPPAAGARGRIRLYARPAAEGAALGIDSNRYVATYFRVAMGFDAKDASLRWVRNLPSDVVGGSAATGGFVLCDASGKLWIVDEAGGDAGSVVLGQGIQSCVVQTATFSVPDGKAAPSIGAQIAAAIQIRETDMAAVQRFLLLELGKLPDAGVTKTLIDIASNPRTPEALLGDARTLLAARRTGAEHMLEALKRHYDFLGDVLRPPPVGPLADALAAINDKRAAPLLAEHLNDPANSADDVERTARALAKLASAAESEELKTFFALYRATADQRELVNAVIHVAEALLRVGGPDAERQVRQALEDPLTNPNIKSGLAELLPPNPATSAR